MPRYTWLSRYCTLTNILGRLIQKKLKVALADYMKYKRRYNKLVRGIPAEKRERWLEERQAFEDDPTAPDPYYVAPSGEY